MRRCIAFISFVLLFGTVAAAEGWVCPSCGNNATGNFCNNCGSAYSSAFWICPQCGNEATGNICNNCGSSKPEENETSGTETSQDEVVESVAEPGQEITPESKQSREELLDQYRQVGNIITFGRYEQDNDLNNGPEEIEWIVLDYDEENNKVLLISKSGLNYMPYINGYTAATWEKSIPRHWLNGEFINDAFTHQERSSILTTEIDNSRSQGYSGWRYSGGNNTTDYVFLLSYVEANRYLNVMYWEDSDDENIISRVSVTPYAIAQGIDIHNGSDVLTAEGKRSEAWWLRSPGIGRGSESEVTRWGEHDWCGSNHRNVIRPALWLDLNAIEPKDMRYLNEKAVQSNSNDQADNLSEPETIPKQTLSPDQYNTYAAIFVKIVKDTRKRPDSMEVYSIRVMEYQGDSYIVIDFSAMNSFGGYNRETYSFKFEQGHISLSGDSTDYDQYEKHKSEFSLISTLDVNEVMKMVK